MHDLAVVIVSWNVRRLLCACLDSLLRDVARSGLVTSVHVVDNCSTDGTPELVAKAYPEVKLTASTDNLGFAAGNNVALRQMSAAPVCSPRYVWLLNPDTEVTPGATRALVSCLDDRPSAGMAGPKLVYADGSLQHSAFRFPGLTQLAFELFGLPARLYESRLNGRYPASSYLPGRQSPPRSRAGARRSQGPMNDPFCIDHPLGAAMMVRMEAVDQIGLLDESYHMYCEEIDWCWRMARQGWQCYCAPASEVIHHAGQSSGQVPVASFTNLWTSRARLYSRIHGPVAFAIARQMVTLGMRRRARHASPAMTSACEEVIRAWSEAF